MSGTRGAPPDPDERLASEDTARAVRPGTAFRDNRQRVGQGTAFMAEVHGDVHFSAGTGHPDDVVTEYAPKPRLREGPYPAGEISEKLCGFVEPPSHVRCRKVLDGRILVLRAEDGTGASTAAFALLVERHGTDGITGLDPTGDPTRWRPGDGRGYLLRGLSQEVADSLGEVALRGLADLLLRAGAHLVVTVGREVRLPADTLPWQVTHLPPQSYDVAVRRLHTTAEAGGLTDEQLSTALGHLASRDFIGHLRAHPLPGDGVELAEGLREAVVLGKSAASVPEDLRLGGDAAARTALGKARHSADAISLIAAIALLQGRDRTVVERFAAELRPLLRERAGMGSTADLPERTDVLGPALEDRLEAVGAELLPPRAGSAGRHRYPVQPVGFSGRHRSEALLRRLWLDHEGMPEVLWRALDALPHQSGIDMAAGRSIGAVLAHATGPSALRQLALFAASDKRWQRRLVAYALGEVAQHVALGGAVREQLRDWSRWRSTNIRCTVAETCAGSYGLARPEAALRLLDGVLDGSEEDVGRRSLWTAVSFALGVLLTEKPNHVLVLDKVTEWLASEHGTLRHAFAADAVEAMALSTFPRPDTSGPGKVSLADVMGDHPRPVLALVTLALDTSATYEAVAEGLLAIEDDPRLRHRAAFVSFLSALSEAARGHRGFTRLMLRRHRNRTITSSERAAS